MSTECLRALVPQDGLGWLPSCVTLDKMLNLSWALASPSETWGTCVERINEMVLGGVLPWCLAHSQDSIQVGYRCHFMKFPASVDAEAEWVPLRWWGHDSHQAPFKEAFESPKAFMTSNCDSKLRACLSQISPPPQAFYCLGQLSPPYHTTSIQDGKDCIWLTFLFALGWYLLPWWRASHAFLTICAREFCTPLSALQFRGGGGEDCFPGGAIAYQVAWTFQ